jgi:exoribonuclease R
MQSIHEKYNTQRKYQIMIDDRNYHGWYICDEEMKKIEEWTSIGLDSKFHPVEYKMFTKDIFIVENGKPIIIYSYIRNVKEIACVLLLENNKTFGRTKQTKRLLYKCIPDDKHLPIFLVPYDVKIGFSKVFKNKYIVCKFDNWEDKHPQLVIVHVLGSVDNLEVFYEYQLYCRSLHISLTDFTNKTREILNKKMSENYIMQIYNNTNYIIENRTKTYEIITIDPIGSLDYDDGLSIRKLEDGSGYIVSVYIANVFFWLETFQLWKSFTRRISTIYLPDRRRPMLPTILSDTLCSLQEDTDRFSFVMDVKIDNNGSIDKDSVKYCNALIRVKKNYVYEDPDMITTDPIYKTLFEVSKKMDPYISTSHDLVAHWMIVMNAECGKYMYDNRFGIFRTAHYLNGGDLSLMTKSINTEAQTRGLSNDVIRVIKQWNNVSGQYVLFDENKVMKHVTMNMGNYIHITSPIRRLVDLLNQIELMGYLGLVKEKSQDVCDFLKGWMSEIEYINVTMRSIRKVQTSCELMHRCHTDENILNNVYNGVVFDKIEKEEGFYSYMVYLEDIKMLSKIRCMNNIENLSVHPFKLYLFESEDKIKKKVRLQLL